MRLLVVEDDPGGASYLVRGLSESGHVVDHAPDGEGGLAMACEGIYDALVVDRRLPKLDGLALVTRLRAAGVETPVLMLSAIAGMRDRVEGMDAGCDDYLPKPYAFAELHARIEAIARRYDASRHQAVLKTGDLEFNPATRIASRGGRPLVLHRREALLLEKLMRHAGQVVTRAMLLEAAWDYDFDPKGNVIDRHIHRLRQKIDAGQAAPLIHTVKGAGYVMSEQAPDDGAIPRG